MTKRNRTGKSIYVVLAAVCAAIFIGCGLFIIDYFHDINVSENIYESFEEVTIPSRTPESINSSQSKTSTEVVTEAVNECEALLPNKDVVFSILWETNLDVYSYIYIPNTNIDYPVLRHPTDNKYYLEHNIDRTSGYPGVIYTENYNDMDYEDPVTLMYGHNMKNGSMFATLHNYENPDFFNENRYVYIYKPYETIVYEIFAAVTYSNAHIMKSFDFDRTEEVTRFIDSLHETRDLNAHFAEEVGVTAEDKILVMSTCTSSESKRFLVCAVKKGSVEKNTSLE